MNERRARDRASLLDTRRLASLPWTDSLMAGDSSMIGFWPAHRVRALGIVLGLVLGSTSGCGDDGTSNADAGALPGDASVDERDGGFFPSVDPTDPCAVAGYVFDGKSACDVVRCPELTCECGGADVVDAGEPAPSPWEVTLSACVPGQGCLELADCKRVCDRELELSRQACEERIAWAGAQSCNADDDCAVGVCRDERVGSICADALRCGEDGHCGEGSACLFDPSARGEDKQPTSLGTCADGRGGSHCYDDDDCVFGRCSSQLCTAGAEGEACTSDGHCASGLCRITGTAALPTGTVPSGSCTRGEQGSACSDDGDCRGGLHCTGSVCFSDQVGQSCERDDQCESSTCVAGRCRGGEPGSQCEDDGDCTSGVCAASRCASGTALSPCYEASDCASGLSCLSSLCSDGSEQMPCSVDTDCKVLACVSGTCSAGEDGARCDADDDCVSERCADPAGADRGACTSGQPSAVCVSDLNCVSGSCAFNGVCE
jgi:hypothetical protein